MHEGFILIDEDAVSAQIKRTARLLSKWQESQKFVNTWLDIFADSFPLDPNGEYSYDRLLDQYNFATERIVFYQERIADLKAIQNRLFDEAIREVNAYLV